CVTSFPTWSRAQAPGCAQTCPSDGSLGGLSSITHASEAWPCSRRQIVWRPHDIAGTSPLPRVRGLAFLGFPLHAVGQPSEERGKHLFEVEIPMLFLQGTRDALAGVHLI